VATLTKARRVKEISVRELKDRLSEHLRAVKGGHSIVVTSHKKPVARLSPVEPQSGSGIQHLIAAGHATWNGKKPRGAGRLGPVKLHGSGPTISDMVLADRG
jgi:prevent-host-death family protein